MTPLTAHLIARIKRNGPLRVSHYMEEALGHPDFGYYMNRDPFGVCGDFTTAPEISQMFGELIGAWCASQWLAMGSPSNTQLIELGPGRGTLMADALRATRTVLGFHLSISLHLVETSLRLRSKQSETLSSVWPSDAIQWWRDPSQVPDGPAIIIANEFFDALPVRQFKRMKNGWCERRIGLSTAPNSNPLTFVFGDIEADPPACIPSALHNVALDSLVEVSPVAQRIAFSLSSRLATQSGAALFIDYGHTNSGAGDTLQAVKDHAYWNVLDTPGEADLTTHVDFDALAHVAVAGGAEVFGAVSQKAFLEEIGLAARADALVKHATPDQVTDILQAKTRLTAPEAMGNLFKVLALAGPGDPAPPGFNAG